MITRVVSQHMVKLNVVDFVGCSSLESLLNDGVLRICYLHPEVVKDGLEACEGDEACAVAVLVLEVGLDQDAAVSDIGSEALEASDQDTFLCVVQNVLGV